MKSWAETGRISPKTPVFSMALNSSIPTTVSGLESESRRSPYNASGTEYQSSILCSSSSERVSHFDRILIIGSCSLNCTSAPSVMAEMKPLGDLHRDGSDR